MKIEISQRNRVLVLLLEIAIVVICSYFALGQPIPPTTDKGLWFYTALYSMIVGSRILTPYYIKPIDVIAYSAPAFIALIYLNDTLWNSTEKTFFIVAVLTCGLLTLAAIGQILTKDSANEKVRLFSESLRLLLSEVGRPQVVYTLVMSFAIYTFHRESVSEVLWIGLAWALTVASSPIESLFKIFKKIYDLWKLGAAPEFYGDVVAYQKPNIILFRETLNSKASFGMPVLIKDLKTKDKVAIILDNVGRDEGLLKRCVEIDALQPAQQITKLVSNLPDRSVSKLLKEDITPKDETSKSILENSGSLVGIVAPVMV